MKTVDEIFKLLSITDREFLMHAFETGIPDKYVEWEPGRFIGVNITQPQFHIEQQCGFWVEGWLSGHTVPFPAYSVYSPFESEGVG